MSILAYNPVSFNIDIDIYINKSLCLLRVRTIHYTFLEVYIHMTSEMIKSEYGSSLTGLYKNFRFYFSTRYVLHSLNFFICINNISVLYTCVIELLHDDYLPLGANSQNGDKTMARVRLILLCINVLN